MTGTNVNGLKAGVEAAVRTALRRELPGAMALRRELHAAPCVSGQEGPTLRRVLAALPGGVAEHVAGTGAVLRIGGPGPAVGVRGELDALPITERTGVPWAAVNGAMHACGHDVHLAAVVALARAVAAVEAAEGYAAVEAAEGYAAAEGFGAVEAAEGFGALGGFGAEAGRGLAPLLAVLQPREETVPSGASDVVASGVLTRHHVRAMIGAHVQPVLPEGTVACVPGAVNAASDEFRVIVKGGEGHAAYPHLTRDPVLAMAQVIVSAQQLVSRVADPMAPTVVTFGTVNAGDAPNAVPGEAVARGTLRTMSPEWRGRLHRRFKQVAEDTARAYGCNAVVEILPGEPVLINDPALTARTGERLREHGWSVNDELRSCGADDFARYGDVAASLMMFVGVDTESGLHSPGFLPGDAAVDAVAQALLAGYLAASSSALKGHRPHR
ncbi:M20 metallopeptidase family protein [Nonomuraea gerenzanensis]|uniref:N-acyl-L-amino acid amidohydrolase n=1 Tax=Nonomuraea gerenzanensis TaxID=93944 RepID=A0A1M4E9C1_9ACTN|nr:M20/M25/M40 family metallo-hydrolase [Nonomuraea gerenzanensis]UBU17596.1 M20/M25/M40 family metallo-hydrolase [Nonomuraea gerenzanensis]SBO95362.1 N-acyl-L-amino acid amidohydrolase [Nonomuraea gerenzanensis]